METKLDKIKSLLAQERRKSDRLKLAVKIFYSLPPSKKWLGPVDIENIGGGGLMFKGKEKFKKGAALNLRIELPKSSPILTQGEVVWQKRTAPQKSKKGKAPQFYDTGVRFYRMSYPDRRRYVSYLCEKILNEYLDSKGRLREEKWI